MKQLHDMCTFTPINGSDLTKKERADAIASLMFLTEKRDGRIKGCACADGRKQREHIKKEDAASPTAALESILITSTIAAHERRDLATIDIPGAYLHTPSGREGHHAFEGPVSRVDGDCRAKTVQEAYFI